MALVPVFREDPDINKPIAYHYFRDTETGEKLPVYYYLKDLDVIVDNPIMVESVFADLFYRDNNYALINQSLGQLFKTTNEEGEVSKGAERVDLDGVVHLILPEDKRPELWLETAVSIVEVAPEMVESGKLAVVWAKQEENA